MRQLSPSPTSLLKTNGKEKERWRNFHGNNCQSLSSIRKLNLFGFKAKSMLRDKSSWGPQNFHKALIYIYGHFPIVCCPLWKLMNWKRKIYIIKPVAFDIYEQSPAIFCFKNNHLFLFEILNQPTLIYSR